MNNRLLLVSTQVDLEQQIRGMIEKSAPDLWITRMPLVDLHKQMGLYTAVLIDLDSFSSSEQQWLQLLQQYAKSATRILFLKSNPTIHEVRAYLKKGAFDVVEKPLKEEAFHNVLQELIATQKSDQDRQEEQRLQAITYLKTSLAYDLLFGSVKNSKEIWDRCSVVGLSVVPNTAMVIHIDDFYKMVKNKSNQWEQSIRNDVIVSIKQYLSEVFQDTLVVVTDADKIAVLLAHSLEINQTEYKRSTKELAEAMKQYVFIDCGYSITIGIGNYYEDARNLHVSYREAYRAQQYKFYNGKNQVIHVEEIGPIVHEEKSILNYDLMPLMNKVTIGDFAGVKEELVQLEDHLFSQRSSHPQVIDLQILDMLTTLARAAIQGGAKPKEVFSIHLQYSQELKQVETMSEMKQWFAVAVEKLLEQVLQSHNEQTLRAVQKAISYIDSHFHQHITLEEISEFVSLSPNYFSNMFKKATGLSFIEYVSKLRIEKSKELLMDLNWTVYQIALEIGYNDSRYFSRVFKSVVGKTPTQYRNSMIGRQ